MNKLTDCFHVVIKLVAVNKSPVSNKLLNHDDEGEADAWAADKKILESSADERRRDREVVKIAYL